MPKKIYHHQDSTKHLLVYPNKNYKVCGRSQTPSHSFSVLSCRAKYIASNYWQNYVKKQMQMIQETSLPYVSFYYDLRVTVIIVRIYLIFSFWTEDIEILKAENKSLKKELISAVENHSKGENTKRLKGKIIDSVIYKC